MILPLPPSLPLQLLQAFTYLSSTMSEFREDSVYLAKLAEQAERYEGE